MKNSILAIIALCAFAANALSMNERITTAVFTPKAISKVMPAGENRKRELFIEANGALTKLPGADFPDIQEDKFAEMNSEFLIVFDAKTIEVVLPWLFDFAETNSLQKLSEVPGLSEEMKAKFAPSAGGVLKLIRTQLDAGRSAADVEARMKIAKKLFTVSDEVKFHRVYSPMPPAYTFQLISDWHDKTNVYFVEKLQMNFELDRTPRPIDSKRRGKYKPDRIEPMPYIGQ